MTMRICVCVSLAVLLRKIDSTYALNWTETPELALQVLLSRIVAETGNNESLEGIASDVWILVWVV